MNFETDVRCDCHFFRDNVSLAVATCVGPGDTGQTRLACAVLPAAARVVWTSFLVAEISNDG